MFLEKCRSAPAPALGAPAPSNEENKSSSPSADDAGDIPSAPSSRLSDDVTAAGDAGGDSLSSFMRDWDGKDNSSRKSGGEAEKGRSAQVCDKFVN